MSQPSTQLTINSNHQNTSIHTAVENDRPPLKNLSEEEKDDYADSLIQEKMQVVTEARKRCPMSSSRGLGRYVMYVEDSIYYIDKPVCLYQIFQYALNIPCELRHIAFTHRPSHVTIVDDQNREFIARLRNKNKKRKDGILGKGWKVFVDANDLKLGDVLRILDDPKYPDRLYCQ
ncbi:hypothetical protein PIB30_030922, partial [Stylosanthes scabra]|nr:hypothetical protein [Stylosanthes scabra]